MTKEPWKTKGVRDQQPWNRSLTGEDNDTLQTPVHHPPVPLLLFSLPNQEWENFCVEMVHLSFQREGPQHMGWLRTTTGDDHDDDTMVT